MATDIMPPMASIIVSFVYVRQRAIMPGATEQSSREQFILLYLMTPYTAARPSISHDSRMVRGADTVAVSFAVEHHFIEITYHDVDDGEKTALRASA